MQRDLVKESAEMVMTVSISAQEAANMEEAQRLVGRGVDKEVGAICSRHMPDGEEAAVDVLKEIVKTAILQMVLLQKPTLRQ